MRRTAGHRRGGALAVRLLRDESGIASPILAMFLLFAVALALLAWAAVSQVQTAQRQVDAALAFSLKVAAIDGTTTLSDGAFLVDQGAALAAAQQAVPQTLPVTLVSTTADGATYVPASGMPGDWGTLTLSGFTVSNASQAGGALCYGGTSAGGSSAPPLSSCPYVQATLSLPYALNLFGYPLHFTYTVTETQVLDTYDAQTQTYQ